MLKPQGVLVIEVPNVESTCQSPKDTFHEAHLFNFNIVTLSRLVEKASFIVEECSVSADGGNITLFARKTSTPIQENGFEDPDRSSHLIKLVRNHTPLKHYLSSNPYARLFRRIRQFLIEKDGIRDFECGRYLLDRLFSPLCSARSNQGASRDAPAGRIRVGAMTVGVVQPQLWREPRVQRAAGQPRPPVPFAARGAGRRDRRLRSAPGSFRAMPRR